MDRDYLLKGKKAKDMTFGQRLSQAMKDGGVTPAALVKGIAKLRKIAEGELLDWMAEKAEPAMEVKLDLASHLGVPVRWLAGSAPAEGAAEEAVPYKVEGPDPRVLLVALEMVEEVVARAKATIGPAQKAQATLNAYTGLVKMGLEHREAVRDLLSSLLNLT